MRRPLALATAAAEQGAVCLALSVFAETQLIAVNPNVNPSLLLFKTAPNGLPAKGWYWPCGARCCAASASMRGSCMNAKLPDRSIDFCLQFTMNCSSPNAVWVASGSPSQAASRFLARRSHRQQATHGSADVRSSIGWTLPAREWSAADACRHRRLSRRAATLRPCAAASDRATEVAKTEPLANRSSSFRLFSNLNPETLRHEPGTVLGAAALGEVGREFGVAACCTAQA